jgi:hypothetical protein
MSSSLSLDLRVGSQEAAGQVGEEVWLALTPARVLTNGGGPRRAQELRGLVLAYRAGPKRLWGPVLLDRLAPAILERLQRLKARAPVIDPEDIRQQLIVEVLQAAATMPLPENPAYLRRALIARANQGVRRKLARERAHQLAQRSLDSLMEKRT